MENDQKFSTDPSIINLKAELLRKQEEFRRQKVSQLGTSQTSEYETNKTQSTWGKKKPSQSDSKSSQPQDEKEQNQNEELQDDIFEKSKKMLEAKAKYYEDVIVGKKATDSLKIFSLKEEGDDELFLVDFDKKVIESNSGQENKDQKLKLKREVDENTYNEELRQKWEKDMKENLEKGEIHYANLRYDEIRNMGVGNYKFSTDEETRKAQMEFFKNIQTESKMNRVLNEIYRLKREKLLVERISKVKQRRLLKFGYTLEQINSLHNFQSDIDEIEKEISDLENVIKNPELLESKEDDSELVEERDKNIEFKRRNAKKREWDKPKLKDKMWKNQVERLRNQRIQEFAPPTIYESKKKWPKHQQ